MNTTTQESHGARSPTVNAHRNAAHTQPGFRFNGSWLRLVVLLFVLIGHTAVLRAIPPLVWADSEMAIDDASPDSRSHMVASRKIVHHPEKS